MMILDGDLEGEDAREDGVLICVTILEVVSSFGGRGC